jgi:hypothetical protein
MGGSVMKVEVEGVPRGWGRLVLVIFELFDYILV